MKNLFNINGNLWIKKEKKNFIGPGRINLLKNIQLYGSISKAAKEMKMSYKAAWDSVDIMNKLANKPLVTKVSGGKGGGGTVITSHAKELIKAYEEITRLHKNYFETLENSFNDQISETSSNEPSFCRLLGKIRDIKYSNESCEISIKLKNKQELTAIENKNFIEKRGLKINEEINLLIETDNITIIKEIKTNISARNQLIGEIESINNDNINSNISINCKDGIIIHAKITSKSCKNLELKKGDKIIASFKAYNIIIL